MKSAQFSFRAFLGLAVAGAALLSAGSASAQTASPFYSFNVNNLTSSNGDPVYSVYDSVTFSGVQVNEVFADSYAQSILLGSVQTTDMAQSSAQVFTTPNGNYTDPIHGALTSATVTGTMTFPGFSPTNTLSLTIQPTADPNSQYQQSVFTPFTAFLFGSASPGVAIGTFSLLNLSTGQGTQVNINAAPVPAAVPEASTTVSLGLLLALGLGTFAVARRRQSAARAD